MATKVFKKIPEQVESLEEIPFWAADNPDTYRRFKTRSTNPDYKGYKQRVAYKRAHNRTDLIEGRENLREGIYNQYKDNFKFVPGRPTVNFVFGNGGTGKSTFLRKNNLNGMLVDADEFKNLIPEYQKDREMVSAVHEESSNLKKRLVNEIIEKAKKGESGIYNYPKVEPSEKELKALKDAGFQINAYYLHAPKEKSQFGNYMRYENGGRAVPSDIYQDENDLRKAVERLMQYYDTYQAIDYTDWNDPKPLK